MSQFFYQARYSVKKGPDLYLDFMASNQEEANYLANAMILSTHPELENPEEEIVIIAVTSNDVSELM